MDLKGREMNIFASIKEERKLSLNHWRYRLLHWCFNEDAKTPEESSLPKFLYTHYCPLFHLTNFIALLSPFVLGVKIFITVSVALFGFFASLNFSQYMPSWPEAPVRELTEEEKKQKQWASLWGLMNETQADTFGYFWETNRARLNLLSKKKVKAEFKIWHEQITIARAQSNARRKRRQEMIIFWVNFSRAFVKWFLYAFYIGLAALSVWLVSISVAPFWSFLCAACVWLFNFEYSTILPLLVFLGKFMLISGCALVIYMACRRFRVVSRAGNVVGMAAMSCMPPFALAWRVAKTPFKLLYGGCVLAYDFTMMFYEENCPPITIISEKEESVREVVE